MRVVDGKYAAALSLVVNSYKVVALETESLPEEGDIAVLFCIALKLHTVSVLVAVAFREMVGDLTATHVKRQQRVTVVALKLIQAEDVGTIVGAAAVGCGAKVVSVKKNVLGVAACCPRNICGVNLARFKVEEPHKEVLLVVDPVRHHQQVAVIFYGEVEERVFHQLGPLCYVAVVVNLHE